MSFFFCWIHFNIQEYAIMFRGKGIEKEIHNIPWTFGKPLALSHLNITRDNSPTGKCFQFRDKWCRHKDVQRLPQDHPNRKSRQWDLHLCCLGSYYSSASASAFCSALGPWEWDSELNSTHWFPDSKGRFQEELETCCWPHPYRDFSC